MTRSVNQPRSGGLLARLRALFHRSDPEQARRQWLITHGRIIEGMVIDLVQNGNSVTEQELEAGRPCLIIYRYTNSGVTYESSQELSPAQMARLPDYRVGTRVNVRYDPRHPTSSLVE
ncbi:MAG: DUF3592 domain-containing protein [Acidobacteriota bacterium]